MARVGGDSVTPFGAGVLSHRRVDVAPPRSLASLPLALRPERERRVHGVVRPAPGRPKHDLAPRYVAVRRPGAPSRWIGRVSDRRRRGGVGSRVSLVADATGSDGVEARRSRATKAVVRVRHDVVRARGSAVGVVVRRVRGDGLGARDAHLVVVVVVVEMVVKTVVVNLGVVSSDAVRRPRPADPRARHHAAQSAPQVVLRDHVPGPPRARDGLRDTPRRRALPLVRASLRTRADDHEALAAPRLARDQRPGPVVRRAPPVPSAPRSVRVPRAGRGNLGEQRPRRRRRALPARRVRLVG
mmetsp:Transcript_1633/g.6362  ORF Transcript_1633/g.6362 Transcript_1633/m.6362 type:complete len:299 (-) Transcript_1633:152-1048(-)